MEPADKSESVPASIVVGGREMTGEKAVRLIKGTGSWYYWIAGFSIVNWLAIVFGLKVVMVVGLGVTQVVTALAVVWAKSHAQLRGFLLLLSFVVTLLAAGAFALLGYHARKMRLAAQIAGMILYGADALIFIRVRDWIAVGFHAFALLMLWTGLSITLAIREARAREAMSIGSLLQG